MPRKAKGAMAMAADHGPDEEPAAAPPPATIINPPTNDLTLNPSDILDESINVTIPKGIKCRNVNLGPAASIAPFIDSINPPGGFGPITAEHEQTLTFRVRFHGIPCKAEPQVFLGTIDVVCDARAIAKKDVKIAVPACRAT